MTAVRMAQDVRESEIAAALRAILEPGQVTELRALGVRTRDWRQPHTVSGYFDDPEKLATAALQIESAQGIYFVPNPINSALLARAANRARPIAAGEPTTSDSDILCRRWLLIDVDPVRPSGISASAVEHEAAIACAAAIREALTTSGWPAPILADSGNGGHLMYRIDLPAEDQGLVKRVLAALAFRFDDGTVTTDRTVCNPARIWKLYGTPARKGDSTAGRPHRVARLLDVPDRLEVVPCELLEALAGSAPAPAAGVSQRTARNGTEFDLERWIVDHGLDVFGPHEWQGGRKWIFETCPWNADHRNRSAYIVELLGGAIAAGCHHNGCNGQGWKALREMYEPQNRPGLPSGAQARKRRRVRSVADGSSSRVGRDEDARPEIHLRGGQLPATVDAAEEALLAPGDCGIYQRGGSLVRAVRLETLRAERGVKRRPGALIIHPVEVPYLTERFTQAALWMRLDRRMRKWKAVDCPERIAKTYLSRLGAWKVPPLLGIIEAPTLRPDGSVLSTPGYDEATGLLFDSGGAEFAPIADKPTDIEVAAALDLLNDLLVDFPFVAESDRSVAVSAIFSGLIRRSLKTVPLHAFRAPKMRSGKTLLADCASLFATGRPCAVMSVSTSPEEERKRLLAVLLAGDPVVCYDNIDRPFGGAAISQALTQESITDRLLGVSKTVTAPTSTLFLATGNNLIFEGDITSRVLPCDIDPACERPEERTFKRDLYEYIPAHRGELVAAALTILRAYHVAGRPKQDLPPWGGFDEWSDWVRAAIVWIGMADPAEGRRRVEEVDPVRRNLRTLLGALRAHSKNNSFTANEIAKAGGANENDALRAALEGIGAVRRGEVSARILGNFLAANEKRIEDGLRIERNGEKQRATLWRIVEV